MKRLVIAGTHSGSGKTTIAIGLMAAFARRGLKVQPFKVGPDYIDSAYHTQVVGRASRNLDDWMLPPAVLRHLFTRSAASADIALVEGVMGLYDGIGSTPAGSTAAVAKTIRTPVILVVDAGGMSTSAAAQVLGYQQYDRDLPLQGVIINRAAPGRHYESMREAIERATGVRVLGCLPPDRELFLPSRHLGLVPTGEMDGMRERMDRLCSLIETHIDLEGLLRLAAGAPDLPYAENPIESLDHDRGTPVKLAVASDRAFNFYYQDSLDLLEDMGAELIRFSPIGDGCIPPEAAGVYLGGGFPEVFAADLAANRPMLDSLNRRLNAGLPCYAECGGLMYLTGGMVDRSGAMRPMAGVLGGAARMTDKLQRFGYVEVRLKGHCLLGGPGDRIRGHEFHYSEVDGVEAAHAYRITSAQGDREWEGGYIKNNVLAGYPHLHFWNNPRLALNFLDHCRRRREVIEH
ncbi:MAG: cobyrinate a,c-diamide synthase [Firmicutes bacterium]|nr:cobyrinate a,c-diamide synthase [Bacillota bacterium]